MERREFILKLGLGALFSATFIESCKNDASKYTLKEISGNANIGHLLRSPFAQPANFKTDETDVLIVGGGIAGLSAARILSKNKSLKTKLIELANETGGNALGGKNNTSAYPWAAHYLPIPSLEMKELIAFLTESNIISHFENDIPFYHEEYLCFDNKERLFINGKWQNGIVPHFNLSEDETKQIDSFMKLVHSLKDKKDDEGKYYFDIPVIRSSQKNEWFETNKISAYDWLMQNHYTSKALHWYINYCTSDDFGSNYKNTSAWAMFHYFSSRKGKAGNADFEDILTWPEGNHFLAKKLIEHISTPIYTNEMALHIQHVNGKIEVFHQNTISKQWTKTICNQLVLNTPFHVVKKLLPEFDKSSIVEKFNAYPWLVANITLKEPTEKNGMDLSWDNVIYNVDSLGFIHSNHQTLSRKHTNHVFTYYKALNNDTAKNERKKLFEKSIEELNKEIIAELQFIYPDIEKYILSIEIKKIGHGMTSPTPNFLFSETLKQFSNPYQNIHFTHTDFCGMSIFEEAFYKGLETAHKILNA